MTRQEAINWQDQLFPRQTWRLYASDNDQPARATTHFVNYRPTLLTIVLDLRGALTGAADPWPEMRVKEARDMLSARLQTWYHREEKTVAPGEPLAFQNCDVRIDNAVHDMVECVVRMADLWLSEPSNRVPVILAEVVCKGGHLQKFRYVGFTREYVEHHLGLMDGTSPLYKFPPREGDGSVIGKCGIPGCMTTIKSRIVDRFGDTPGAAAMVTITAGNGAVVMRQTFGDQ